MQIYDTEVEVSSGGIFELVYECFVVKNLTKRESWTLNVKKTQNNFKKSDAFGIILKLNQSSIILPRAFFM